MNTDTATLSDAIKAARDLNREILSGLRDINNVLSTAENVGPLFHNHYVNMETGRNGIENLITDILTENGAYFDTGIEHTPNRGLAIASAMFASDIIREVQNRFSDGTKRYPDSTIYQYLSVKMFPKGTVGKITLTNLEDCLRECNRPRLMWYIVKPVQA